MSVEDFAAEMNAAREAWLVAFLAHSPYASTLETAAVRAQVAYEAAGGLINRVPVGAADAVDLPRRKRCSGCWGAIVAKKHADGLRLECTTPGCTFPGVTSNAAIERKIAEDNAKAYEARAAFYIAGLWAKVAQSGGCDVKKVLSELGFD